jgi:uncharacterized membrane protein YhiD involved in acid resistance
VAGIGIVVGYGHVLLGVIVAAVLLLVLEVQHIPFLKFLDAATYAHRFQDDRVFDPGKGPTDGSPGRPADV